MPQTNKTAKNTFNNNRDTYSRFHPNRRDNYYYYRRQYALGTDYNNYARSHRTRQKLRTYRPASNATPPPLFPPRPPSPFSGTEEHTLRQIQATSDMIKKQLSMPFQEKHYSSLPPSKNQDNINNTSQIDKTSKLHDKADTNKQPKSGNKKPEKYNVGEIHDRIINHITNLSHGRKMNLIARSNYSGYDPVIERIQKQKRLELSKVLRDMCSNNQCEDQSNIINNIIPDFGIKIEDLPIEIIQELSSTLDIDFNDSISSNELSFDYEIPDIQINTSDREFKIEVKSESDPELVIHADLGNSSIHIKTENSEEESVAEAEMQTESEHSTVKQHKVETASISTQTEEETLEKQVAKCSNLDHAVHIMFTIDKEVARLTKLRQSVFKNTKKLQVKSKNNSIAPAKTAKKTRARAKAANQPQEKAPESQNVPEKETSRTFETALSFQGITNEKILVVKVMNDTILAGSESGKLFFLDLADGRTKHAIQVSTSAITSFCHHSSAPDHTDIFVGSLEKNLKHLVAGRETVTCIETADSIQCLELAWNCVFVGSTLGNLMRFSLKKKKMEFADKIRDNGILVLKATQEGTRKVLLVGSKFTSVCVVDAMSGLHMRTMFGVYAPTVYSLLLEKSLVLCGTTVHNILVYSFHDGNLVTKYEAANSKGIGCMKIVQNLLYAGCHNGNIYVYNISKHSFVGCISGPGGVILSMEIIANIIIVGTLSSRFTSILIPASILEENN